MRVSFEPVANNNITLSLEDYYYPFGKVSGFNNITRSSGDDGTTAKFGILGFILNKNTAIFYLTANVNIAPYSLNEKTINSKAKYEYQQYEISDIKNFNGTMNEEFYMFNKKK
ncbi:MAG: hypothetical protein HYV28_02380 [Ignavibacteriales bacterium]|nr:hypothetical protein [Ignavibacteriales bacterium]